MLFGQSAIAAFVAAELSGLFMREATNLPPKKIKWSVDTGGLMQSVADAASTRYETHAQ
jgi:hypothetical protein